MLQSGVDVSGDVLQSEKDAVDHRLNTDFAYFCDEAPMLIAVKEGGDLIPFKMNRAQRYIHSCVEKQLKEKGWVRALLLKGRQQGGSTYVNARFYWKTSRNKGRNVFILSHEGKTTDKLFDMVKRFHDNVDPRIRPETGKENTRQLVFTGLGSNYAAGTAGNKDVGRGGTAQMFHGSEAAYWEWAYDIQNGAIKSIGLVPNTEIILESTANGPVGLFFDKCQVAMKGEGDYILIFVPWFWQDEYARDVPPDFTLTEEERVYVATYFTDKIFPGDFAPISKNEVLRKMAWRRAEIVDLSKGTNNPKSGAAQFRNIYPSNPVEAFLSSGAGLVLPEALTAARASKITDIVSPLIAGVDPAGEGANSDRTVIALRRGRVLEDVLVFPKMGQMELAGVIINDIIVKRGADKVFVDRGYGDGPIDRVRELGYGRHIQGVAFNERSLYPDIYSNKRSEILIECAKWLNAGGVRIPDRDDIHADFSCMPLDKGTSNNLRYLPPKEEIKKVLGRSPDIFDAVGLTFSYPVRRMDETTTVRKAETIRGRAQKGGPLKTLARIRGRSR